MTRTVKLTDDTNVAVFTRRFENSVSSYTNRETRVFKRIYRALSSDSPQREVEKTYSNCEELQQLREGDLLRIYCRLVRKLPDYNVLYVFEVDKHKYRDLQTFDEQAKQAVREVQKRTTVGGIEDYLDERNTFTASDVERIIEDLQSD